MKLVQKQTNSKDPFYNVNWLSGQKMERPPFQTQWMTSLEFHFHCINHLQHLLALMPVPEVLEVWSAIQNIALTTDLWCAVLLLHAFLRLCFCFLLLLKCVGRSGSQVYCSPNYKWREQQSYETDPSFSWLQGMWENESNVQRLIWRKLKSYLHCCSSPSISLSSQACAQGYLVPSQTGRLFNNGLPLLTI